MEMGLFTIKIFLFTFLATVFVQIADARILTRCSLARELQSLGIRRRNIANWVCIARYESNYNTAEVGPPNPDGSRDWGLFHINDRYWCDPGDGRQSANACRVSCQSLITDDIRASVTCAQEIIGAQGLTAWNAWNNNCARGANVQSVNDCL